MSFVEKRSVRERFGEVERFFSSGSRDRGRRGWLMILPVLALFLLLAALYTKDRVLNIPVIIKPLSGDVTGTDIYLFWNPVRGDDVKYHSQLDDTGPEFRNVVYEWDGYEKVKIKRKYALPGDHTYYWRVRSIIGGEYQRWSRTISFRTGEDIRRWKEFGLDITDIEIDDEVVHVAGRASLPDGTLVYIQLNDPRKKRTLYRIAYRIRKGVFERDLKPDPERLIPGTYEVEVSTFPVQEYPVSEILGKRGCKLREAGVSAGDITIGIMNSAVFEAGENFASTRMSRRDSSALYLDLEARPTREGAILISGETNLPDGAKLSGVVIKGPNGRMVRNNYLYVKGGKYRGEVKPQGELSDFGKSSYRVYIVLDPIFQQGRMANFFGPGGEEIPSRIADRKNLVYILRGVRTVTIE